MHLRYSLAKCQVSEGKKFDLRRWPTRIKPLYRSKKDYRRLLQEYRNEIAQLQSVLYAHDRYALLLIFQGMDTAGKDGAIKHVMSGVNPQGCQVFSFKQPSSEELDHDFLWRTNRCLPERGRIGIFNRSYYEDVVAPLVHPEVLANQRLPEEHANPKKIWRERYEDIVNMEKYLHRNGTRIIKFFLHVSKDEQKKRLIERIDEPDKNWKLTRADIEGRSQWEAFQSACSQGIKATTSDWAPWHVIAADDKRNARLLVSHVIVEVLKTLRMHYPDVTAKHRKELQVAKRLLLAE